MTEQSSEISSRKSDVSHLHMQTGSDWLIVVFHSNLGNSLIVSSQPSVSCRSLLSIVEHSGSGV